MRILICPGNIQNAKSYPHWDKLRELLKDYEVREIKGILPEQEIVALVNWADVVVTIDSFLPHLIKYYGIQKTVVVLWGKSDPDIFGYKENINLLKDREYLKPQQFQWWLEEPNDPNVFVSPEKVMKTIRVEAIRRAHGLGEEGTGSR